MVHDGKPPDLILASADKVNFHIHNSVLHDASGNGFADLLEALDKNGEAGSGTVEVPEDAQTLNVVLLTVYGKSSANYQPPFEVLLRAVAEFEKYAIDPKRFIRPSLPLFELIRFHMPLHPLDVYSLAGHYDLYDLAVAASSHLLGYNLSTITDDAVVYMGAVYTRRLYALHMSRYEGLKKVLVLPPEPHPSTTSCSLMDQTKIARAWAMTTTYLIWDGRAGAHLYAKLTAETLSSGSRHIFQLHRIYLESTQTATNL